MLNLVRHSCFLLLFWTITVQAQQTPALSRKSKALYEKAKEAWEKRNLNESLALYGQLADAEPTFAEAHMRLGQIHEMQHNQALTQYHYRKVTSLQPPLHENSVAYLWVAKSLFFKEQYDSALHYFQLLKPIFKPRTNGSQILDKFIASSEFAQEAIKKPLPIQKQPLSSQVNFLQAQFFPVLTADNETLIFTGLTNPRNEDMYESRWDGQTWTAPKPVSAHLNSANNEGTCSVSADGRTLVFTACGRPDSYGSCDLYIARKEKTGWQVPTNVGNTVNSSSWDSQPSLSADGSTLYFVSDRPGGYGKTDIWLTRLDSTGNWTSPVNLGKTINSPGNENAPFIHANGSTLFYSSDHFPGMGGFDIFMSTYSPTGWTPPQNLGYPINTAADQVGLYITSDGKKAYYTDDQTAKSKGGQSLLYTFDMPETLKKQFVLTRSVKGAVHDRQTGEPLMASIKFYDLRNGKKVSEFASQAGTGEFLVVLNKDSEYAFYVEKENYLFKSLTFTPGDSTTLLRLDIPLEKVQKDRTEVLTNIYFESGKDKLDDKSKVELQKLSDFLTKNPRLAIEIAGYTDDVGNEKDNVDLSIRRAKSVTEFLQQLGIAVNRLKTAGYGEANPKVPNISEENRMRNRRIEWRIL